jgi:hypothetical protein
MFDVFQELSAGVAEQIRHLDDVIQKELPTLSTVSGLDSAPSH